MRVAMLMDGPRLALEQRLLNRLGVGLMTEGIQLLRVVPEGLDPQPLDAGEKRIALARRIEAPMHTLPFQRGPRLQRVVEAIGEQVPDVLLLCGRETWPLGLDLARELDRPALIEVWTARLAESLPRIEQQPHIAGFLAPCEGVAAALRRRVRPDMVITVPMGVTAPHSSWSRKGGEDQPPAIIVLGGSRDVQSYQAMLAGLSRVIARAPGMQVFLELGGPNEHDIWRATEAAGLRGAVSAIACAAAHRTLVLDCDIVLWPEVGGDVRSLLLEAMGCGLAVVARADPLLDFLADGETALLVAQSTPESWEAQLRAVLADPAAARAMGERARALVGSRYRSSEQVRRLVSTLERVGGSGAYAFPVEPR